MSNEILSATRVIDWEALFNGFARQHDMSRMETLRWISNRTSLQVACEVLGVSLSPSLATRYTSSDLAILNELADLLSSQGLKVPRLMEYHRLEYKQKGRPYMGFSLSRDEYLRERGSGKSKNKIAKEQGISGPALFHWLHKWGLKDVDVEQREIERMLAAPDKTSADIHESDEYNGEPSQITTAKSIDTQTAEPNVHAAHEGIPESPFAEIETERAAETIAMGAGTPLRSNLQLISREPKSSISSISVTIPKPPVTVDVKGPYVQLFMPIVPVELPETLKIEEFTRDEMMVAGLGLLQKALGQACEDLKGLLGESAAREQIQKYIEYQVEKFLLRANSTKSFAAK